jgi:aldehyde dehydrogenase (NAD+)
LGFKAGAALAAGNTVIFKASEKTPLGVLHIAPLFAEAGFPPGVINFVSGGGAVGAALASHMDVRKISFTGSAMTGKKIMIAAAQSNLKRVTLELGGKGSAIVFEDADLETVATNLSDNFLRLTGQICHSSSRLLVHENIAKKVLEMLKERYEMIGKGLGKDPMEKDTMIGPLADAMSLERVIKFMAAGTEDAELVTGGERLGDKGCFVSPTIFMNPKSDASIYHEEIFGPVLTVKTFRTEKSAIEMANDTEYGLAASVYTRDMALAMRVAKKLEVGNVSINSSLGIDMNSPFGGKKGSGIGKEGGQYGLKEYLEAKTIKIKLMGFK